MKQLRFSTYLLGALLLSGCSDDNFYSPSPSEEGERTFSLYMPGFTTPTRSMNDESVNSLRVFFYDSSDQLLGNEQDLNTAAGDITPTGQKNVYEVTLQVPGNTAYVKMYANLGDTDEFTILNDNINDRDDVVFFGKADITANSVNPSVSLVRTCAKTTVNNNVADGFELEEIYLYNLPESGLIEPSSDASIPNLPSGLTYSSSKVELTAGSSYYHYEAPKEKCFIIIKGRYNDVTGYYKAAYILKNDEDGKTEGTATPILRNHHYIFEIVGINDYGWPTEQAAVDHDPDNRMKVLLNDYDESIYNMIACRDYYLGVGNDKEVDGKDESADVKIITSFENAPGYNSSKDKPYEVVIPQDSWITGYTQTASSAKSQSGTSAVEYTLTFTFSQNNLSSENREETIIVKSGDLIREFKIIQGGWDFFRDDNRKVMIYNLPGHNPTGGYEYFKFLDEELQGETEEEMGVSRTDALHFEVYPQGTQFYYTIPKLDGDAEPVINKGSGKFSVTADENNWKVVCTSDNNYEMWDGEFVLSNSTNHSSITYKVYHVGLFHQLIATNYLLGGPDGTIPSGWFYYEQVKVGNIYMLDRNLGASSNKAYHPAGQSIGGNTEARGAYYKISLSKDESKGAKTGINTIPPKGYEIPTETTLNSLTLNSFNAQEGIVGVSSSAGLLSQVYYPYSGDMNGEAHVDVNQVCLWTQTLLSGYQGFAADSPEYGYWFRYYNITGSKSAFKNVRIGNMASGGGVGDIWRAMPVRCMTNIAGGDSPVIESDFSFRIAWDKNLGPKIRLYDATSDEWIPAFSDGYISYSSNIGNWDGHNSGWYYMDGKISDSRRNHELKIYIAVQDESKEYVSNSNHKVTPDWSESNPLKLWSTDMTLSNTSTPFQFRIAWPKSFGSQIRLKNATTGEWLSGFGSGYTTVSSIGSWDYGTNNAYFYDGSQKEEMKNTPIYIYISDGTTTYVTKTTHYLTSDWATSSPLKLKAADLKTDSEPVNTSKTYRAYWPKNSNQTGLHIYTSSATFTTWKDTGGNNSYDSRYPEYWYVEFTTQDQGNVEFMYMWSNNNNKYIPNKKLDEIFTHNIDGKYCIFLQSSTTVPTGYLSTAPSPYVDPRNMNDVPSGKRRFFWNNKDVNWTTVNLHYKNGNDWTEGTGEAMTRLGTTDYWYIDVPQGVSEMLFNNGTWNSNGNKGNQTDNITPNSNKTDIELNTYGKDKVKYN